MSALLGITVLVGIALLMGYIGRAKKFGFWGNFAVTLLLTPIVGIIVYFAQSNKHSACHSDDEHSKCHSHHEDETEASSEAKA